MDATEQEYVKGIGAKDSTDLWIGLSDQVRDAVITLGNNAYFDIL